MRTRYVEIYINCDNAAFDLADVEVARILHKLAADIAEVGILGGEAPLTDLNGNRCGSFKFFERNTRATGTRKRGGV